MSVFGCRRQPAWRAAVRKPGRSRKRPLAPGGFRASGLFIIAEMENHMWTDLLCRHGWSEGGPGRRRNSPAAGWPEVAEGVLRGGMRCLLLGRHMRVVSGPLAGCVGLLTPRSGSSLSLHIIRRSPDWELDEYAESAH
ncbi:MAG: hypothetical protein V2A77_06455 [Pseudomonadota bacterium]